MHEEGMDKLGREGSLTHVPDLVLETTEGRMQTGGTGIRSRIMSVG